jgi:hypothetical protein
MTRRELVARLLSAPIVVEPLATSTCYRIALHADPNPQNGVRIPFTSVAACPPWMTAAPAIVTPAGGVHRGPALSWPEIRITSG